MKIILYFLIFRSVVAASLKPCNVDNHYKCYNGGTCMQFEDKMMPLMQICSCMPGFTGRQCEQLTTTSCTPNPCGSNGFCNVDTDIKSVKCNCKPGFKGTYCKDNINDCVNATCYNGGSCKDGINTYECDCPWPYTGRYCETKQECFCKNNSTCIDDVNKRTFKCTCLDGYEGDDCSILKPTSKCKSEKPCLFGGKCVDNEDFSDFKCECPFGRIGKICQFEDVCVVQQPCKNNSTCIQINGRDNTNSDDGSIMNSKYLCQCKQGYTGFNCDIAIDCIDGKCMSKTRVTPHEQIQGSSLNGSFVLILNLTPDEFRKRKMEIINEFSHQMNIFMMIKKDANYEDMIYPYEYGQSQPPIIWTKVYFIIIFACIDSNESQQSLNLKQPCLNDLHSLNDIFKFVKDLKHSSNLPNYVSNITYEANEMRSNEVERVNRHYGVNNTTIIIVCIIITVLTTIIILLGMIVRQQQQVKRVKAPVWYPSSNDKSDLNNQTNKNKNGWSFQSSVKNLLFKPDQSPPPEYEKPLKMCNTSDYFSSTSTTTSPADSDFGCHQSSQNEFLLYPSPPESIPDPSHNPFTNMKGPSDITPLMCVLMNRKQSLACTLDLIDTLITKGADVNLQNASNGETVLHYAIRTCSIEICERLLNYGADVHVYDKVGRTALHTAVGTNSLAMVKLLLHKLGDKLDIDIKTSDQFGETSLIYAARNSFNELLKLLITFNSTINATDNNGQSALHHCAKVNNCQGAVLLLEAGANINLQDENEKTPITTAIEEVNTSEIIKLLIKYQAFVSTEDEKLLDLKKKQKQNRVDSENETTIQHQPASVQRNKRKLNEETTVKVTRQKSDVGYMNQNYIINQQQYSTPQIPQYQPNQYYNQQANYFNNQYQNYENTSYCAYF